MTQEEFTQHLRDIKLNLSDEGKVTELLANISDGFSEVVANANTVTQTNEQLTQDNESLRASNMQLFLRIGVPAEKDDKKQDEEPKKKSFDELFNEKGERK